MTDETPGKPKGPTLLFTAPVEMHGGDEITLLFGRPVLIKRDGVEIWRNEDIPQDILNGILKDQENDHQNETRD